MMTSICEIPVNRTIEVIRFPLENEDGIELVYARFHDSPQEFVWHYMNTSSLDHAIQHESIMSLQDFRTASILMPHGLRDGTTYTDYTGYPELHSNKSIESVEKLGPYATEHVSWFPSRWGDEPPQEDHKLYWYCDFDETMLCNRTMEYTRIPIAASVLNRDYDIKKMLKATDQMFEPHGEIFTVPGNGPTLILLLKPKDNVWEEYTKMIGGPVSNVYDTEEWLMEKCGLNQFKKKQKSKNDEQHGEENEDNE